MDEPTEKQGMDPGATVETSVRATALVSMLESARLAREGFETLLRAMWPGDARWSEGMTALELETALGIADELDRIVPLALELRGRYKGILARAEKAGSPGGVQ